MINLLQVNIGVGKAAQDFMFAAAWRHDADIIIVSEQYRASDVTNGWYCDATNKAAVVIVNKTIPVDAVGPNNIPGHVWIQIKGIRYYSCYWSPNTPLKEFEYFLGRLEVSIRNSPVPCVVAGDFNAHSPEWGSPNEDCRGTLLADLASSTNLSICNNGQPTFIRGISATHIDVTLASIDIISSVAGWCVLNEESLSLHKYITYSIGTKQTQATTPARKRWSYKQINKQKLQDFFETSIKDYEDSNAQNDARQLTEWLTRASDVCMPRVHANSKRQPVYWWNTEIAELRRTCMANRRKYQRKRRKTSESECANESAAYRASRKLLIIAINVSKRRYWAKLCAEVDRDPWGRPYRTVIKKLAKYRIPADLYNSGRIEIILKTLFPDGPMADINGVGRTVSTKDVPNGFTIEELLEAARNLPNGKCPGPDGILNELVKRAVIADPQRFLKTFDKCVREAHYPAIWKSADLVLIPKPGKQTNDPTAYRPLCMIDSVGKLFEKLLVQRLREHLTSNGSMQENQYGFRNGRSTCDALGRLKTIVSASERSYARYNKVVGMLTLDVQNAFNTAPWPNIIAALGRLQVPEYLIDILKNYLSNRTISVRTPQDIITVNVTRGVPQGSVLGPDLWNILYDELLKTPLPKDVEIIAFADDVALVATADDDYQLEDKLETAYISVSEWMEHNGLTLAAQKTEALVLTRRRVYNKISVRCGEHLIESKPHIKYLGVQIDAKLNFGPHAEAVCIKAAKTIKQLTIIMPNLGGARESKRKLLGNVVQSQLLYGAPFWSTTIGMGPLRKLETVHRRTLLRVICAYRTVSYAATCVVATTLPLKQLAEERRLIHEGKDRTLTKIGLMEQWQELWNTSSNGRWTFALIPNIQKWVKRKHGNVHFHLTQFLTGHGSFGAYLLKFGRRQDDKCQLCGVSPDTVQHAIFECDMWHKQRLEIRTDLGQDIRADNIVEVMLESEYNWNRIDETIRHIMKTREDIERNEERRQQLQ